jgi:hypothetical protein
MGDALSEITVIREQLIEWEDGKRIPRRQTLCALRKVQGKLVVIHDRLR